MAGKTLYLFLTFLFFWHLVRLLKQGSFARIMNKNLGKSPSFLKLLNWSFYRGRMRCSGDRSKLGVFKNTKFNELRGFTVSLFDSLLWWNFPHKAVGIKREGVLSHFFIFSRRIRCTSRRVFDEKVKKKYCPALCSIFPINLYKIRVSYIQLYQKSWNTRMLFIGDL